MMILQSEWNLVKEVLLDKTILVAFGIFLFVILLLRIIIAPSAEPKTKKQCRTFKKAKQTEETADAQNSAEASTETNSE